MGTVQRQRTGTPTCSVCGHADADALMSDLANGERVADVAARYEISSAAIYRHQRNHAVVMTAFDIDTDSSLSMVDRLVGIMDRARAASQLAYERGDLRAGALIGDAAVRAANSLQGFGINSEKIAADYKAADESMKALRRKVSVLVRTLDAYLTANPDSTDEIVHAAESVGAHDLFTDDTNGASA